MNALAGGPLSILALGCVVAACTTTSGVLTHGSAERVEGRQVVTVRAAPAQGTLSTAIVLVTERSTRTASPPDPEGARSFTEARLAPGGHEVRVLCSDPQAHRLLLVDVDASAGHFYTLRCELAEVAPGQLGTRVVVTDDGTARPRP